MGNLKPIQFIQDTNFIKTFYHFQVTKDTICKDASLND